MWTLSTHPKCELVKTDPSQEFLLCSVLFNWWILKTKLIHSQANRIIPGFSWMRRTVHQHEVEDRTQITSVTTYHQRWRYKTLQVFTDNSHDHTGHNKEIFRNMVVSRIDLNPKKIRTQESSGHNFGPTVSWFKI